MLSTRNSVTAALRAAAIWTAVAILAACGNMQPASQAMDDGVAVDPNQPVRVALLAPLGSGDEGRERIGRSLVNAAMLAQGDLRNATIDLSVYPTGGTSAGGASAAAQAVSEGASIIVGPLFSTATAGAGSVASQAGLTMLSLSNNATVAGSNVYVLGNTFDNTADRLVAWGQSQGLGNFAVVYPNGLEGETARNAVAQAVQRRGAQLVSSQGYNLSVEGIEAAVRPMAAQLQSTGANAIILTDGPTGGLAFISDGLRRNGLSPATAQFLGMQRWDITAETLALPSAQGGVFAAADPGLVNAFSGRYQNAYGEAPHELAGLAYDGIAAVGAMIAEARVNGGSPFSTARLTQPAGFAGVNGAFRFLPGGMIERNLAIVQVRDGQPVVIAPASRSFGPLVN